MLIKLLYKVVCFMIFGTLLKFSSQKKHTHLNYSSATKILPILKQLQVVITVLTNKKFFGNLFVHFFSQIYLFGY